MRMLKTTAAICVSIVLKVTIVSVQMNAKCLKTTRPVNVQKVSRSRSIGQCAWVSVKKDSTSSNQRLRSAGEPVRLPKGAIDVENRFLSVRE